MPKPLFSTSIRIGVPSAVGLNVNSVRCLGTPAVPATDTLDELDLVATWSQEVAHASDRLALGQLLSLGEEDRDPPDEHRPLGTLAKPTPPADEARA